MASRVKITSSAKSSSTSTTTSGGYFSGAQLAKNVRSFISGIKKA